MFPRRPALALSSPKPFSGLVGCVVSGPIKAIGGSFWSLGRRASQDRQPALGNCPPSPKPARLQSAGQALDRRAHLRLVYEAPPPGTRLRNQNRKCGSYASPYDDRRDAEARPLTTKKCFLKQALRGLCASCSCSYLSRLRELALPKARMI